MNKLKFGDANLAVFDRSQAGQWLDAGLFAEILVWRLAQVG